MYLQGNRCGSAGSEKNKIVQEDFFSVQFCPRQCVNIILIISQKKQRVLCPWHGQVIKRYVQLSIPWTIGNVMENCPKKVHLSKVWTIVHDMDKLKNVHRLSVHLSYALFLTKIIHKIWICPGRSYQSYTLFRTLMGWQPMSRLWQGMVGYGRIWYCVVRHGRVGFGRVFYGTVQYREGCILVFNGTVSKLW